MYRRPTIADKKAAAQRAEDEKVAKLLKEDSFPSLSAVPVSPKKTILRGHASLAAEWQKAENDKAEALLEAQRLQEKDDAERRLIIPNFYNRERFEEPENTHLPIEDVLEETSAPPVDDGWTTVQRKKRKPKKDMEYPDELESEESYDSLSDEDIRWRRTNGATKQQTFGPGK